MKRSLIFTILIIFIAGCSTSNISGTTQLILNEQDLQQLGMASNGDCNTESYQASESSPLTEYSICNYIIPELNNTEVFVELKEFSNSKDLDGAYQYESLHYRSIKGLLSENKFGDKSRFYVNNEGDYGAEFNPPDVYFYALYITKDNHMIYVTSKGTDKGAEDSVKEIGLKILSKFE